MSYLKSRFWKQRVQWTERMLLALCLTFLGVAVAFGSLVVRHEQQYVRLAESFVSGRLDFVSIPEHWDDTAKFDGKYYWPLGPLPAIILMPFVAIFKLVDVSVYQGYLSILFVFGTSWMCFRLAKKFDRTNEDSLWLTLAFCGASSYLGVATISMSWPFAQVVAIYLIFVSLHELFGHRRWWLIGFLLGLTAATRITAGLNILLFTGAALLCESEHTKKKVKNVASVLTGFAVPMVFLAIYNFLRFSSIFETGYNYQLPAPGDFAETSFNNVMPHLFVFLFGLPIATGRFPFVAANTFGMTVFLLSPWLVYLVSIKIGPLSRLALVNCAVVLLAVLAWRSTGQIQLGYRFSLDFLPILIFLLARDGFGGMRVTGGFKTLVFLGFISTLYFLKSFIELIPVG